MRIYPDLHLGYNQCTHIHYRSSPTNSAGSASLGSRAQNPEPQCVRMQSCFLLISIIRRVEPITMTVLHDVFAAKSTITYIAKTIRPDLMIRFMPSENIMKEPSHSVERPYTPYHSKCPNDQEKRKNDEDDGLNHYDS